MKAIRLIEPGRPLEAEEVEIPQIGDKDILVRVRAAGICHSDAHYRAGVSPVRPLPLTLGHEVAGEVEIVGEAVTEFIPGDRVCLHYMVTCGNCEFCLRGSEQFCTSGSMIGKYRDGGYAEYISIPSRSAFALPDEIPFEQGAILMCSSATSYHALKKTRLKAGERVAIFGVGGLGMSALQLALTFGARQVFAVDINPRKLAIAQDYGAIPIHAGEDDPVDEIHAHTDGKGVDVALELIGLSQTTIQAVRCLSVFGRAGLAGLTDQSVELHPYEDIILKEAELIGVSDHLAQELPTLIDLTRQGKLRLHDVISKTVPLSAAAINQVLDDLGDFREEGRVVIVP
jgi:propanol-preferring alcohol dehydrogenase